METFDFTSEWAEFQRKYPKGENANLPLEDYADYLSGFYDLMQRHSWYLHDCREQLPIVRGAIREVSEALLYRLDSLPMNEETNRKLLKLLFSIHFSYTHYVDTMLQEQAEYIYDMESEVTTLKKEISGLDPALWR